MLFIVFFHKINIDLTGNRHINIQNIPLKAKQQNLNYAKPEEGYKSLSVVNTKNLSKNFTARKIDWEKLAKSNKLTGEQGELLTIEIEQKYLNQIDKEKLANKIIRISEVKGDGAGYEF